MTALELEPRNNADAMWLFIQQNCWYPTYTELTTERKKRAKILISFRQGLDGSKANCEVCKDGPFDIDQLWVYHKDANNRNNILSNLGTAHRHCIYAMWRRLYTGRSSDPA